MGKKSQIWVAFICSVNVAKGTLITLNNKQPQHNAD